MAGDSDNFNGNVGASLSGATTRGKAYLVGDSVGVAQGSADANQMNVYRVRGAVHVAKAAGSGITLDVGDKVYFVSGTNNVTNAASGNTLCGIALAAAGASDTEAFIYLG